MVFLGTGTNFFTANFTYLNYARTATDTNVLSALTILSQEPAVPLTANLLGISAKGDGQGGLFYWDYLSTMAPDGTNYFLSTNTVYLSSGRWIRVSITASSPPQPPIVATPTFSPTSGGFVTSVNVTILDSTPSAVIYYTLDGSTPTTNSTLFVSAFTLTNTTTVKAFAVAVGYTQSAVATKIYSPTLSTWGFWGTSFNTNLVAADINVGPVQGWSQTTVNYLGSDSNYTYEATSLEIGTYRFYGVQDTAADPDASDGFFISFVLLPGDFASIAEGFPLTDTNGWPYYSLALTFAQTGLPDGNYRVYRLLNEITSAFTLRVRQF